MDSKYQWPASGLTAREMEVLYEARLKSGTPITELLRLAVLSSYETEKNRREEGK